MCSKEHINMFKHEFSVKYESAVAYCDARRNVAPPLYFAQRMNEQPVPNVDAGAQTAANDIVIKIEPVPEPADEEAFENILIDDDDEGAEVEPVASTSIAGIDDDDIIFLFNGVFPKPILVTSEGLIKRENDPLSGNLAYLELVRIFFSLYRHMGMQ